VKRLSIAIILSFILGALVPVIAQRAQIPNLWIPLLLASVVGACSGALAPGPISGRILVVFAATIGGVFVGLTVDAMVDWFYFAHDRNLIGVEWAVWGFLMGLPAAVTACLAGFVASRIQKSGNSAV